MFRPAWKRPLVAVVLVILLGGAIAGGYLYWHHRQEQKTALPKQPNIANVLREEKAKTPEGALRLQLADANQAILDKHYDEALDTLNDIEPKLGGDDLLNCYGMQARAYGLQNKLDKVQTVAVSALALSKQVNNTMATQTWQNILNQAKAGTNPYTQPQKVEIGL